MDGSWLLRDQHRWNAILLRRLVLQTTLAGLAIYGTARFRAPSLLSILFHRYVSQEAARTVAFFADIISVSICVIDVGLHAQDYMWGRRATRDIEASIQAFWKTAFTDVLKELSSDRIRPIPSLAKCALYALPTSEIAAGWAEAAKRQHLRP